MQPFRSHFEEVQRQLRIDDALKTLNAHYFDPAAPKRLISGIALSGRERNSKGISFCARGMTSTLPAPLLIEHDWDRVVGRLAGLEVRLDQAHFRAEIGNERRTCDDVWMDIIIGNITGVSVRASNFDDMTLDGAFKRWHLDEISLTRSACDPGARVNKCWEQWPTLRLNGPSQLVRWHRDESGEIVRGAVAWGEP